MVVVVLTEEELGSALIIGIPSFFLIGLFLAKHETWPSWAEIYTGLTRLGIFGIVAAVVVLLALWKLR